MALTFSDGFWDNIWDGLGLNAIFANGYLRLYSGSPPTDAEDAATGTLISTVQLPATPFADASGGDAAKAGVWQDPSAAATETATYFRLVATSDTGGASTTEPRIQGTAGESGDDLTLNDETITAGQVVTITAFTLQGFNA